MTAQPLPLTAAQRQLCAQNVALAFHIAAEAMRGKPERFRDDVQSAACLGLVNAAARYQPQQDAAAGFGHYAGIWIRGRIAAYWAKNRRRNEIAKQIQIVRRGDGDEPPMDWVDPRTLPDKASSPHDIRADRLAPIHVAFAELKTQDPRRALVLERRLNGEELQKIGDSITLTRERVRQLERDALRFIRRRIPQTTSPKELSINESLGVPPCRPR